jgi:hypothetical protein
MKKLTQSGVEKFDKYLSTLAGGSSTLDGEDAPPTGLLEKDNTSEKSEIEIDFDFSKFGRKYELVRHLHEALPSLEERSFQFQKELFATFSLANLKTFSMPAAEGGFKTGNIERHIPRKSWKHRYRHLIRGPYLLYSLHGEDARVFLTGNLNVHGSISEQIASRQELVTSEGVIQALNLLYFNEDDFSLQRGHAGDKKRPGSIRRFATVIEQLKRTHDLMAINGEELVKLLPSDFDEFLE